MPNPKREDRLLFSILIATLLIAISGRMFGGAFTSPVEVILPIATELGSDLTIEGDKALININTDDQALLVTLPGIGPALSARIIAYRAEHGNFTEIGQLLGVQGIGEAVLERLRERVFIE